MVYISKRKREQIKQKYGGLCAYSGTPLEDDWQVDHVKPIIRDRFNNNEPMFNNNNDDNLVPVQKLINHYKRGLTLEEFRSIRLKNLHKRLALLPKNPITDKSKKRNEYMRKIAGYFGITKNKTFNGIFYFETL